jgi:putative transposase
MEFKSTRETFGPRRLSKLLNKKGAKVGRVKVERLMGENSIIPKTVRKFKAQPIQITIIQYL